MSGLHRDLLKLSVLASPDQFMSPVKTAWVNILKTQQV
eukprot:CAMPEP_0197710764 /NCGR_PEP_ID=MMETSP1338-20131121/129118_1 /TAXON_ID=43686 ORGANISM="Pelagodinium beii, Strain RCC1491" /NCGR_SAMPLE_ID=MMETSP1338 /ASSEMBLY_ACC=CAM_ASM_000754 /LENGTH=37 /DNA_ID= /DNA_START= /DNA_END= /DNA_ORIENTATION=